MPEFPLILTVSSEDAAQRLDQYLASQIAEVSRARVQQLIERGEVLVNGAAAKASLRLKGEERITITGPPQAPPLRALAEEIPLDIVYEDDDLAIVNKPAGMMVHAGAGATDDARNRGTLVNALLHHFQALSGIGGELRPGIVHRLDRSSSGLMVVAKNDEAHRQLAKQFSARQVHKTYLALVHGWPKQDRGTVQSAIGRHTQKRTRMTTRGFGGRDAVTHYLVKRKIDSPYGKFALLEVKIETGRTHQIRVHMTAVRHPCCGDLLYGADPVLASRLGLTRQWLHAVRLSFAHPATGAEVTFESAYPEDLARALDILAAES